MTGLIQGKLNPRLTAIKVVFILIWGIFVVRLIWLQIIDREKFLIAAEKQQSLEIDIQAKRGTIYDRNYKALVQDIDSHSYYIVPEQIKDKRRASRKLRKITGSSNWLKKFKNHPRFLWVARKTDKRLDRSLNKSKIETLNRIVEPKRVYLAGELARSLLGRVDIDANGLSGIEFQYNELLHGMYGKAILKRDGRGNSYRFEEKPLVEPCSGSDLVLTIDLDLQQIVEQELKAAMIENNSVCGISIFMKVGTGEIMACAVLDSLGKPSTRNRAITDQYEPGSTFKIVTAAAALSDGLFEPDTVLFVENGKFRIGKRTIHDDHEFDSLTVEDIIVYSSNIGAAKMALALGDVSLFKIIKEAGFNMPLGVDFPAEASGYVKRPDWREHYLANVSFGHGISASPLQIAALYEMIASDGYLHRPFIGKEIIDTDGNRKPLGCQQKIRQVITPKVKSVMNEFLKQVVICGTAQKASSDMVAIAGKTGTALKLRDDRKGYDWKKARASFVGYFPADNPMIVGIIIFDEPKNSRYGGETAAPVFKNIAERYYCLPQFMVERIMSTDQYSDNINEITIDDSKSEFALMIEASARYHNDSKNADQIPDFKGLTIKQALVLAAMKSIECEFDGSGLVYSQTPAAGKKYINGTIIKLRFKSG